MKTIIFAVLIMSSSFAAAQVNKCIDAKSGKVTGYGNDCPAGSRSEKLEIQKAPSASAQKSFSERDAEFRKRQVEKQEAEKKAQTKSADADRRKQNCDSAQAYLKTLESKQRVTKTDPKTGERTFLDDADYPRETARARASVADNCKG